MACKYVKDFEFSSDKGFTGSAGKTQVKGYARGGSCKMATGGTTSALIAAAKNMPQLARNVAAAASKGNISSTPSGSRFGSNLANIVASKAANRFGTRRMAKGGKAVVEKATGEKYASKKAMVKHEMMETPRMQKEEMMQKRVVKGPAMAAGRDPRMPMIQPMKKGGMCKGYAEGGKVQAKMKTVMKEFGKGELHSGKNGPVVKNPKQAVAIAYSEARKKGK